MIVMDKIIMDKYVKGKKGKREWFNKPFPMFEEIRIICGVNHATSAFAFDFASQFGTVQSAPPDIDPEGLANYIDEINLSIPPPSPAQGHGMTTMEILSSSVNSSKNSSKSGLRRNHDDVLVSIGESIAMVAEGMKDSKLRRVHWREELEKPVMGMQGYDEDVLGDACDHLAKSKDAV